MNDKQRLDFLNSIGSGVRACDNHVASQEGSRFCCEFRRGVGGWHKNIRKAIDSGFNEYRKYIRSIKFKKQNKNNDNSK